MLELDARQKLYLYLSGIFLTALLIGDTIGSKLFVLQLPLVGEATFSVGAMWFPITFVVLFSLARIMVPLLFFELIEPGSHGCLQRIRPRRRC